MNDPSLLRQEARSVVQIAAHFAELKQRASTLLAQASAQGRGYFTPDEDLETKSILGSYWTARNALLEFLGSYRVDFQRQQVADVQLHDQAFLTAFTAALVLVDAARFLRDKFHDVPLVRSKLNESSRAFNIPAGCYDQIQQSLFSARHAWHLYHAIRYFEKSETRLRETLRESEFAALWLIVDQLRHRMDIPLRSYTRARLRARSGMLTRTATLDLLQKSMYGLQKLAGILLAEKYVRWGHVPCLADIPRQQLAQILAPGDILVVRKEFAVTNYFLPGYWPHAALYLGSPDQQQDLGITAAEELEPLRVRIDQSRTTACPLTVLESMKDGVHLRPLDSPYRCDSIVVLRSNCNKEDVGIALQRALSHEGKPYDFSFDFRRSDQLVCTEVAYRGYEGIAGISFPLVQRAGRPTLSGSDLIELALQGDIVHPVAVFAPRLVGASRGVLTDPKTCLATIRVALKK